LELSIIIRIFAKNIEDLTIRIMAKYNITEKREKEAAYRSLVSPRLMDEMQEKILNIIVMQKKYRDKDYSAKRLAEDLGTNTRYISAVVNVRFHMNYTSFVNKYRIDEAMSILVDKRYQDLRMEEVSDMVGFANRQSFYASFFKIMGITPREYRISHLAQHPSLKPVVKPEKPKRATKAAKATKTRAAKAKTAKKSTRGSKKV
jgi:AraC-like DNA-binding protein